MENGLLTARMWPLKCHQDENNRLGPFFAILNLLLVHFQAKIYRNSLKKSAKISIFRSKKVQEMIQYTQEISQEVPDYLEMLHIDFEVSSSNSMAVREIIR